VSEIREVSEHFILSHASREIGEDVVHRNSHTADARLTASLAGLNRDDSFVRHQSILAEVAMMGALTGDGMSRAVPRRHSSCPLPAKEMTERIEEPDPYPPIAGYALIGDTRSAALVSSRGSIDWLCWPRFDADSVFARMLDWQRGGFFAIQPAVAFTTTRRYLNATNVLETTFTCDSGAVRLLDLMPVMSEEEKARHLSPFRQLLRRVEGLQGEVPLVATYVPRPGYGRGLPRLSKRGDCVHFADGADVVQLRSDVPFEILGNEAVARVTLAEGERRDFAMSFDSHTPSVLPHVGDEATAEIDRTIAFWREWSAQLTYDGPYREAVLRSVLVLKLLTYAPSGAVVAAPTTSLPEAIGGVRNWDYRYCWLRDASFTVSALYNTGFAVEGDAFVNWLLYATQLTHPRLQILYDVYGEARLPERTLPHLEGYSGSAPVRIGNDAHSQFQLDVYGEVLGAVEEHVNRGATLERDVQRLMIRLADVVATRWREPDSGIWEKRSDRVQHTHAKIMAWSALDCAERLAKKGHLNDGVERWGAEKREIERMVLERGFHRGLNSFVSILDGDQLDASVLYAVRVGFIDPADPRMLGTIDAIRARLGRDDLVYRYDVETDDGLPPGEGAFLACSFWLVEALVLAGRSYEARVLFEKLLRRSNDVGLLSEECDTRTGALLGNFPQALTHISLLNAALRLDGEALSLP
jgi:GH15 family glucan-1,4-alpha-glucosidase